MRTTTTLAAAMLAAAPLGVNAAPVTGQISLGGYAESNTGSMGTATGISFANAAGTTVTGMSGTISSFGAGSGSFAALGACSSTTSGCGTIKDISSFVSQAALASFLTLNTGGGAVAFDLSAITAVQHAVGGDGGTLTFTATGTIDMAGYDPTPGTFTLTSEGTGIDSFSATLLASGRSNPAVPEPATWAMLLTGFAGIGGAFRMRRPSFRHA